MKKNMKRRSFLKLSSSTAAAIGLSPFISLHPLLSLADSDKQDKHFFVLVKTVGGIDCTLGLDPQIHHNTDQEDVFIEYRPDQIIQAGQIKLGPAAVPLQNHYQDIAVINGLYMGNDLGHTTRYISSGDGSLQSATIAAELAALSKETGVLGLTFKESTDTGSRSIMSTKLSDIKSIASSTRPSILNAVLSCSDEEDCDYLEAQKSFLKAQRLVSRYQENFEKIQKLEIENLDQTYAELASAFTSHGSYFAEIRINNSLLDTHSAHEINHLRAQEDVWNKVDELFQLFKKIQYGEKSLFDATTFLVVSEFSRTPYLNATLGKDHNTNTNSVLIAGRGIQGNQVIGKSVVHSRKLRKEQKAIHIGLPMDFKSGEIIREYRPGLQLLTPKHLIRSIAHLYGDPKGFSAVRSSVPVIPGLLRA